MKHTIVRKTPTKEVLQNIYDVMNKNIKNKGIIPDLSR